MLNHPHEISARRIADDTREEAPFRIFQLSLGFEHQRNWLTRNRLAVAASKQAWLLLESPSVGQQVEQSLRLGPQGVRANERHGHFLHCGMCYSAGCENSVRAGG